MACEIPMSVRLLVMTMDVGGVNVSEFYELHGMSRQSFYAIRRRYRDEGEAGLELRSRAPVRVENKTPTDIEDQIVKIRKELDEGGLDAGPITIHWHLSQRGVDKVPSPATIWRILRARGFIVDDPSKAPKRPHRFEMERANELWQIDGIDWELADGEPVKIIDVIDDASRLCVASRSPSTRDIG